MVNSGTLNKYTHQDLTPVIGMEFEGLQVTELLEGDEQLIKDLAVTVSQRGVVFLRNQDVTPEQMKDLMERITRAAGSVSFSLWKQTMALRIFSQSHRGSMCIP